MRLKTVVKLQLLLTVRVKPMSLFCSEMPPNLSQMVRVLILTNNKINTQSTLEGFLGWNEGELHVHLYHRHS